MLVVSPLTDEHLAPQVRSVDRRVTFKQLESEKPHTFWYRERNWGYASFWRRSEAFYNNPTTRAAVSLGP